MIESTSHLRISEGDFTYLLAADRAATIEHRNSGGFELVEESTSPLAAWFRLGDERVPVVRLGRVMRTPVREWEYAIILSGGAEKVGVAAQHVHLVPEAGVPRIQPFNPVGSALTGGAVVTGVCPGTDPEHLVLDPPRFQRCLQNSAGG